MKTKILLVLICSLFLNARVEAQFSFSNMQSVVDNNVVMNDVQKEKIISSANLNSLSQDSQLEFKGIINNDNIKTYDDFKIALEKSNLLKQEKINMKSSVLEVLKKTNKVSNVETNDQSIGNTTLNKKQKQKIIDIIGKTNSASESGTEELVNKIKLTDNYKEIKDLIIGSSLNNDEKTRLRGITYKMAYENEEEKNAQGSRPVRVFFPAIFNEWGSELSTVFFEGRTEYTQFFQNNNVVYNPNLKNLSFNSEVVNDYLGPIRVGIGFQFNSTVKSNDSIAAADIKKDQLVSSLQNSGGNLFVNVKFPIIALGGTNSSFGLKSYVYHNTGVELTTFNSADNEFVLTNNTGIAVGGFAVGHKKQISAFFEAKGAILYGNSKYNHILSVDSDFKKVLPLFNIGVGINFLDMYTIKAEFYPAGDYIKRNFPATISFIIVPKTK
ncbi:hypothetical protein [Chryseobacterium sp. M5A1_1a]